MGLPAYNTGRGTSELFELVSRKIRASHISRWHHGGRPYLVLWRKIKRIQTISPTHPWRRYHFYSLGTKSWSSVNLMNCLSLFTSIFCIFQYQLFFFSVCDVSLIFQVAQLFQKIFICFCFKRDLYFTGNLYSPKTLEFWETQHFSDIYLKSIFPALWIRDIF